MSGFPRWWKWISIRSIATNFQPTSRSDNRLSLKKLPKSRVTFAWSNVSLENRYEPFYTTLHSNVRPSARVPLPRRVEKKDEQWTKERRTKRDVAGREKNRSRRFAPTARWIVVIRLRLDLHREETTERSFRGRRDLTYSARKNRAPVRAARKTATVRPIPENHWL